MGVKRVRVLLSSGFFDVGCVDFRLEQFHDGPDYAVIRDSSAGDSLSTERLRPEAYSHLFRASTTIMKRPWGAYV